MMTSSQLLAGPYDVSPCSMWSSAGRGGYTELWSQSKDPKIPVLGVGLQSFLLQFEESIRNLDDIGQADNHAKASAILTYYIGIYPFLSWNSGVSCCRGSQGEWMPYV